MSFVVIDDIIDHIDKHWKPGQETYITLEKTSDYFSHLVSWFEEYPDVTINIGPFINIKPYAYFEDTENSDRVEFLFLYEKTDNSKLQKHHLEI